jgi:hypothetical protein
MVSMKTIDEKIQYSGRWREAQKMLDDFEEMIKLIKQHPIKSIKEVPPSPRYTTLKQHPLESTKQPTIPTKLNQKNEFVLALREHLMSKYSTEHHYTCGEGDFEGQKVGDAYCSVRRDLNEPTDINGFYFRKDLCFQPPQSEADVLKEVSDFFQRDKNLESALEENGKDLKIRFGDKEYLVTSYIDKGYAGEINVHFMELPRFFEKVT